MLRELIILATALYTISIFASEPRIKIAIIDSGIRDIPSSKKYICENGMYDLTGFGILDQHGHGTNIAGIITEGLDYKKFCIVIIKWFHTEDQQQKVPDFSCVGKAIEVALNTNAKYINLSLSGGYQNGYELKQIQRGLASGTVFTVASGNNGADLSKNCWVYPACYTLKNKNYHVVSTVDLPSSNYNGPVTDRMPGNNICGYDICLNGTSQATALFLNSVLKEYTGSILEIKTDGNYPAIKYGVKW